MTISIKDSKLSSLYKQMEKAKTQLDDTNLAQVLAAVADSSKASYSKVLSDLQKPGVTKEQRLDLVKAGLSANEKKDLETILDKGSVKLSPSARSFLESVVGRTGPVKPTQPTDVFDVGGTAKPFAALAARGDYAGFVKTASGQELFVSIKLAKDAAQKPPVVMLDGIAARYDRNAAFEDQVVKNGQSIITVYLPGQGETLDRDLDKGGKSLQGDIEQEDQAKAVVSVLDALGVKAPVGVAGLSYGGAIAAQCNAQYPDRFAQLMVIAPFVESQGKDSPYYAMMNNPWNPWGAMAYRTATKTALENLFPYNPEVLQEHPGAFHEGLFRLTMGLEDYELSDTVKGQADVHFLVVPGDTASPPEKDAQAYKGAKTGSFTMAPKSDTGKHDLVRGDGELVARWLADVMAGKVKADPVH